MESILEARDTKYRIEWFDDQTEHTVNKQTRYITYAHSYNYLKFFKFIGSRPD